MLSPYQYPASAPAPRGTGPRTTILGVTKAWRDGMPARSHANVEGDTPYSTDGYDLFSYDLKIGYTDETGHKVLIDYTSGTGHYVSMTTSCHVGSGRSVADKVVNP